MDFKTQYHLYKKEKNKEVLFSILIIACSFLSPISFSFMVQKKIHILAGATISLSFIFLTVFFIYLRQLSLKKIESANKNLTTGMKIKRKSSSFSYEIIQESPHFFYLQELKHKHTLMIAKDKIRKEFEVEL